MPAPQAEVRIEVAGLDGVGKVMLGKRSRQIQVQAAYRGYANETLLVAAIDLDDAEKGGEPALLTVAGATAANCQLIAVDFGTWMRDGKNGLWFAPDVVYLFEQLNG